MRRTWSSSAPAQDQYIKRLGVAVDAFTDELGEVFERIRGLTDPDQLRRQLLASMETTA